MPQSGAFVRTKFISFSRRFEPSTPPTWTIFQDIWEGLAYSPRTQLWDKNKVSYVLKGIYLLIQGCYSENADFTQVVVNNGNIAPGWCIPNPGSWDQHRFESHNLVHTTVFLPSFPILNIMISRDIIIKPHCGYWISRSPNSPKITV